MDMVRSAETRQAFIKYLEDHPEERFWQAVRNFSGYTFVLASDILPVDGQLDTFYWEGRTHLEATQR
jgi:hypothetical protein